MKINILYSLIIAAILQGFWLSFFILNSKKFGTKAAKYLGLLILSVTITQLQYFLGEIGVISWQQFNIIYLPFEFLEAPFLYFFIFFYLYPDRTVRWPDKFLFLPFIFFLANSLLYKFIALITNGSQETHPMLKGLANLNVMYGDFVNIGLMLIVLAISLYRIIIIDRRKIANNIKEVIVELFWLKILLIFIIIVVLVWSCFAVQFYLDKSASYLPVDIAVSIIIYLLGYIGIHKLNILNERRMIRSQSPLVISNSVEENLKNGHSKTIESLLVGEKRFLDPTFSAEALAEELQISKSHLSRIFNNEIQIPFSDYINTLRVEEAKKHLQNPEFSNYTLVAIGLEAGFNSKTTFNTTFKKITGQTPSEFKKTASN